MFQFNEDDIIHRAHIVTYPGIRGWIGLLRQSSNNNFYADTMIENFSSNEYGAKNTVIGEGRVIPPSLSYADVEQNLYSYAGNLHANGFGTKHNVHLFQMLSWRDFLEMKESIDEFKLFQFLPKPNEKRLEG